LKRVGVDPGKALFISDDPISDLVTAGRLGMQTAFVLSGKYPDHEVLARLAEPDWPDIVCSRMSDLDIQEEETD
jgi:ribonucleotide monophosphatase NagD (HAD superfamily)